MAKKAEYPSPAAGPMNQWVRDALAHADMSQTALANELHLRGVISADRSIVQKMTVARKPTGDEILAISQITGFPVPNAHDGDPDAQELAKWAATATKEAKSFALSVLLKGQIDEGAQGQSSEPQALQSSKQQKSAP